MKPLIIYILLLLFSFSTLSAQTDVLASGGSGSGAGGTMEMSWGQSFCIYPADSNGHYSGQGVQQPYRIASHDTLYRSVCQYQPFVLGDFHLPSDSTAATGLRRYIIRHLSVSGCDSITTLMLTIHPVYASEETFDVCDSLVWNGKAYRSATKAQTLLASREGCDSIATLNLTVHYSSESHFEAQAAYSYTWHGNTYTVSGTYHALAETANAAGCDSLLTLDLAVLPNLPLPEIYSYRDRVLSVDHYPNGEDAPRVDYAAYRWYRDGALIPLAQADNYYDLRDHFYHRLSGCFYVEVPASGGRWVHSNILCIDPVKSYAEASEPLLTLSPNPVDAGGDVCVGIENLRREGQLSLFDLQGRTLRSVDVEASVTLTAPVVAGVYMVRLTTAEGYAVTKKLVVR